jgi:surface antigen
MRNIFGLAAGVVVWAGWAVSGPAVMAQEPEPPMFGASAGAQFNAPPDASQREDDQQAGSSGQSGGASLSPQNPQDLRDPQQYAQESAQPAQQAEQGEQAQARQECRDVSGNAEIDGKQQQFNGLACRQPDGTWRIQESDDEPDSGGDNAGAAYPAPDGAPYAAAPDGAPYDPYYGYGYPYPYAYPYDPFWGPPFLFGFGASFVFVDRFHHFHHIDHVHFGHPGFAHGGFHHGFHGGFHGGGFHGGGGGFHGGGGGHGR